MEKRDTYECPKCGERFPAEWPKNCPKCGFGPRGFKLEQGYLEEPIRVVEQYLLAKESHLAAHDFTANGYCYENPNDFDYSDCGATPISVAEAFDFGLLAITEKGIEGLVETLPLSYDFVKIRRRCEDALRKTPSRRTLLEVAVKLGCRLD